MIKKNSIKILKQTGTLQSKLNDNSLFIEPVEKLEDLAFWEKRLDYLKVQYIVAKFSLVENKKSSKGLTKTFRNVYGIFSDPREIED